MGRKIIIVLCLLLAAGQAWGATYYCDCDAGSNGDGSLASPVNSLANARAVAGNDDTINIKGTCTNQKLSVDGTGQIWQAWTVVRPIIISASGATAVEPYTNCTYSDLILDGAGKTDQDVLQMFTNYTGWTFDGCDFRNGRRGIAVAAAAAGTFKNGASYGHAGGAGQNLVQSGSSIVFSNFIFGPNRWWATDTIASYQLGAHGANTDMRVYNSEFYGGAGHCIQYWADANLIARIDAINNIFAGYGHDPNGTYYAIYKNGAGTPAAVNVSNNYYTNSYNNPDSGGFSGPICTNCVYGENLGKRSYWASSSYFIPAIDDYNPALQSYYTAFAAALQAANAKGILFMNLSYPPDANGWAYINSLCATGYLKIGYHSYNHIVLTAAETSYAFAFSTYPVGATVIFDGTLLTITTDGSTPAVGTHVTFNALDVIASADVDTIPELVAEINTISGFSSTSLHANIGATSAVRTDSIKNYNGLISGLTSGRMLLDYAATTSRHYTNEITRCIDLIKANIADPSYIAPAFAYPGGYDDADLRKWLQNNESDDVLMAFDIDDVVAFSDLNRSLNIYKIWRASPTELTGADADTTLLQSRAVASALANIGGIGGSYVHNSTEVPVADWTSILQAMNDFGVSMPTVETVHDLITDPASKTGFDTDADGASVKEVWHFTNYLFNNSNLMLKSNSPAIDAGIATLTKAQAEAAGVTVYGAAPDIGAYEFRKIESTIVPMPIIFDAPQPPCLSTNAACYVQ